MTHKRGEIEQAKDILGDTFYRVYRGCEWLDDFFTCDDLETAKKISEELTCAK